MNNQLVYPILLLLSLAYTNAYSTLSVRDFELTSDDSTSSYILNGYGFFSFDKKIRSPYIQNATLTS